MHSSTLFEWLSNFQVCFPCCFVITTFLLRCLTSVLLTFKTKSLETGCANCINTELFFHNCNTLKNWFIRQRKKTYKTTASHFLKVSKCLSASLLVVTISLNCNYHIVSFSHNHHFFHSNFIFLYISFQSWLTKDLKLCCNPNKCKFLPCYTVTEVQLGYIFIYYPLLNCY